MIYLIVVVVSFFIPDGETNHKPDE